MSLLGGLDLSSIVKSAGSIVGGAAGLYFGGPAGAALGTAAGSALSNIADTTIGSELSGENTQAEDTTQQESNAITQSGFDKVLEIIKLVISNLNNNNGDNYTSDNSTSNNSMLDLNSITDGIKQISDGNNLLNLLG